MSALPRARTLVLVGLVLVGASAVVFSGATASSERTDLVLASGVEASDGRARLSYALPRGTELHSSGVLMGAYRFGDRAGEVRVLGCADHQALEAGLPLSKSARVFPASREGMFHERVAPFVESASASRCASPVYVVLTWPATGDWRADAPSAVIELVQQPWRGGPLPGILAATAALGVGMAATGALRWRRDRA